MAEGFQLGLGPGDPHLVADALELRAFQVLGIPVRVHAGFFVTAVLLVGAGRGLAGMASWVAVAFASVLVHELGHALAFKAFGQRPQIHLHAMGGTTYGSAPSMPPLERVVTALAGPAAGFGLGLLALALSSLPVSGLARTAVDDLLWANIGWGVVNLVPVLPLDGAVAAQAALERLFGRSLERPARVASIAFALVLAALGAATGRWAAAVLGAWAVVSNVQALRERAREAADAAFAPKIAEAYDLLDKGDASKAHLLAQALLAARPSERVRLELVHLDAWAYLYEGKVAEALEALDSLGERSEVDPYLYGCVLKAGGKSELAIEPLRAALEEAPSAGRAACMLESLLDAGRLDEAVALASGARGELLNDGAHAALEAALFASGRHEDAAEVSALRFGRHRSAEGAYAAARAMARVGRHREALDWLERALAAGWADWARLESDADLAPVREMEPFRALRRKGRP